MLQIPRSKLLEERESALVERKGSHLGGYLAFRMTAKLLGKILADEKLLHVKGVGDEHPSFVPVASPDLGHQSLVIL